MQKRDLKILLIEDHYDQARLIEALLKKTDRACGIDWVVDAETGLQNLAQKSYDAVILDYHLPHMDGLQALKIIKERHSAIPVIMVTGQGDEMIAVQAIRQGAHDYIVKTPQYMDLLPRVLMRAIEENRLTTKLEQSEKRYSALFENAGMAIFILNAHNYHILHVNKMAEQLLRTTAAHLIEKSFLQFCAANIQSSLLDGFKKLKTLFKQSFDQINLIQLDGSLLPTEMSCSLLEIGGEWVIQLFAQDISEKLKMQQQILLSRQRYISLFDGITDLISVQDDQHRLIMGNKKYREFTALESKHLLGKKCHSVLFQREIPCEGCPAGNTFRTGQSHFVEIDHDGRTFDIWTFPMSGLNGQPEFLVEYIKDVTEQKEIEKQLIKTDKLATIGLLSSGIAHELRNPLNIIETTRYALEESMGQKDSDLAKKLELIKKNVRRASFIIDHLLHFSRHSEFNREKVNLEMLIDNTLFLVEKEITTRQIHLEKKFHQVPRAFFNLDSLKQVFLNIILNAIQAMPNGGTLTIETELEQTGEWILAHFRDTGMGISEENLKHIFTPFFTTKKQNEGTGLGLYLSYSIIKREGGDITLRSKSGDGTTFTIKLPISKESDVPI